MIQRRTLSENMGSINCIISRSGSSNIKGTIKEKKADKRKEKSRVAAQIRRNKESQTLILLQNSLALALPSPSQMLEKSIVIRIAGQTLFLMNTLDQVLGMNGWLTIPLISSSFLSFFMDISGQIVYTSPNIQSLLKQYHWSNLIGMSIYDIVEFKSRWPINGEIVHLTLPTSLTVSSDPDPVSCWSSTYSQASCHRSPNISKSNVRKSSPTWNKNSLYHVWSFTNINHTSSKLKLLLLQAVRMQPSVSNDITGQFETARHSVSTKNTMTSLQRSISCPSMSTPLKTETNHSIQSAYNQSMDDDQTSDNYESMYHRMITSTHDQYFNFKAASIELCQLIGESLQTLANMNFLEIIHLEDVIEIKSFLDQIVHHNDPCAWTPIYRISCHTGYCLVKTMVKPNSLSSAQSSIVLNHLVIEPTKVCRYLQTDAVKQRKSAHAHFDNPIYNKSVIDSNQKVDKSELCIIRSDRENVILKRKCDSKRRVNECVRFPDTLDRTFSVLEAQGHFNQSDSIYLSPKVRLLPRRSDSNLVSEIKCSDPLLSMSFDKCLSDRRTPIRELHNSLDETGSKTVNKPNRLSSQKKPNYPCNRSPSYSLESYVLTSPGSESTDMHIEDHFIWELSDSFCEINQLNCWLNEQFQSEFELPLPI